MLKKIALTSLITSTLLFAESGVGININEQDLEIEGVIDSRNLAALQTSSTIYQVDINFLNDNEETKLFGLGLGATNKLEGVEGVELTLGAKFMWSEVGDDDFTSLPLMLKVRYSLPPLLYSIPPVAFEGKLLYAPKVLSFGDSETYTEYRVSADIEVIENVKIYAGWRNIHRGYKNLKNDLFNTSFYGGLKFAY
jgi:hypothetical protein